MFKVQTLNVFSLIVYFPPLDFLPPPVCKEEVSPENEERNHSLVQDEPQPPHFKVEQEVLQRPKEAGGSMLLVVKTRGFCYPCQKNAALH